MVGNASDMRLAILAFAAGDLTLQCCAELPAGPVLAGLLLSGAALLAVCRRWPMLRLPAAALLGFVWAGGLAHQRLADGLPAENEGRDLYRSIVPTTAIVMTMQCARQVSVSGVPEQAS